jgi:hypothetical protein
MRLTVICRLLMTVTASSVAATLVACAGKQPEERDIVWESERVVPSTGAASLPATPERTSPRAAPAASSDGCREYTHTVIIDGKEQQAYGRACPQPDGSWRVDMPAGLPQSSGAPPAALVYPTRTYPAYYYPPVFFGSAFYFSGHRHRHHHWHRHRRFR